MAMTDDAGDYALALVVQKLLRALEAKGVLTTAETVNLLDDALYEYKDSNVQKDNDAAANAGKLIGFLYPLK